MRTVEHLNDWNDFERKLTELYVERDSFKGKRPAGVSNLLFRGQSNADWPLTSTLERFAMRYEMPRLLDVDFYYERIHAAKPQIETYTGARWELVTPPDYQTLLEDDTFVERWFKGSVYEYMVYLRHHGFPSPLLDWSRSPYVAAFFAFLDAPPQRDNVAIYAFLEWAGSPKVTTVGDPAITGLGSYVTAHKRHFAQQCEYTVCTAGTAEQRRFGSHQTTLENAETGQEILWKMTLPAAKRLEVLRYLDRHNINSFSLFGSDEGLVETVALRELVLRD